jgi:hypothetical protein
MAYTNATFYFDPVSGSDAARTALTSVTGTWNAGAGKMRMTKAAHGLVTGAVIDITASVGGNVNAAWIITRIDANTFDLDASSNVANVTSCTVTPRGGSSKADAWKTLTTGVSATHHQAGDTIRIIASADPTSLGQNATWTQYSKTLALTTAVTADIETCETAWTPSANITATASATCKEGTRSASIVVGLAFVTGLAAFKAMAATDFSAFTQISFWMQSSVAIAAGQLQLKLCSDNAGTVAVNTINIPAFVNISQTGFWVPITVDTGGALGASIQSVALYVVTDIGAQTVLLDNIIACKAPASADSLTHQSLIGKARNLNWAASTAYSANSIRKPTPPNRNGFCYKVTAGGGGSSGGSEPTWPTYLGATVTDGALTWTCDSLEETWYPIQSIRGATILLDTQGAAAAGGRGYHGTTETSTVYKRECTALAAVASTSPVTALAGNVQASGSLAGGQITFTGGWNSTDMTTQTGETWWSGGFSGCIMQANAKSYITMENLNGALTSCLVMQNNVGTSLGWLVKNCQASNLFGTGINHGTSCNLQLEVRGVVLCATAAHGIGESNTGFIAVRGRCLAMHSNTTDGLHLCHIGELAFVEAINHGSFGINSPNQSVNQGTVRGVRNLVSANNVGGALTSFMGDLYVHRGTMTDATLAPAPTAYSNQRYCLTGYNGNNDTHRIITDGGLILSATDQRHTAAGIAWKFQPTSTTRDTNYPLILSVAKIACIASAALTVGIWVRRDNTNIKGRLMVKGGQIAGLGVDAYVDCAPTINTWANYTVTITPTGAGVIEVTFECYDGAGTGNSLWIDDFSRT